MHQVTDFLVQPLQYPIFVVLEELHMNDVIVCIGSFLVDIDDFGACLSISDDFLDEELAKNSICICDFYCCAATNYAVVQLKALIPFFSVMLLAVLGGDGHKWEWIFL